MIKTQQDLRSRGWFWEDYPDAAKCCELYVGRLKALKEHCLALRRNAIYFDAEDILDRTHAILQALKTELDLSEDLSEEYWTFKHTGVGGGDHSTRIKLGTINRVDGDRSDIVITDNILEHIHDIYERCRALLRARCTCP
jgi:hypothetical protein